MRNTDLLNYWLKATPEFVFFKNSEGQYINTSQSNAELAGFSSPEQMIGKYDYEIYPPEIAQQFLIQDKKIYETKKPLYDILWVNHPKLGRIQIKCFKAPMLDDANNVIGIYGISVNITDKFRMKENIKKQKAKTQTILDNIPSAIWIKNTENKYITINYAFEKFYRVNKADIIGQDNNIEILNNLFSDNYVELLVRQDLEVVRNKKTKTLTLWTNEGEKSRLILIKKAPLIKDDGSCVGLIGMSNEIKTQNTIDILYGKHM